MTMITPSYLGETIEYSSLHACRSTLEDPTPQSKRQQSPERSSSTWIRKQNQFVHTLEAWERGIRNLQWSEA